MRFSIVSLILLVLLPCIFGCSAGDNNPASNDVGNVPVGTVQNSEGGVRMPLGFYSFDADPATGTVEVIRDRSAEMHLNGVSLLESGATQLVTLAGAPQFSNGGTQLDVDIKIKHPNPDKVFTVFDVHGIFISDGQQTGFGDPDLKIAGTSETRLMNPDGLTRWWNPAEFNSTGMFGYVPGKLGSQITENQASTLNGYKIFADCLNAGSDISEMDYLSRGMFSTSTANIRHYQISLASGLKFNYAVDASWAPPLANPPSPPDDFPLKANMPEPYAVIVTETWNSLWFNETDGYGGDATFEIIVRDWQGNSTIGDAHIDIPELGLSDDITTVLGEGSDFRELEYKLIAPVLTSNVQLTVLISVNSNEGSYQPASTHVDKPLKAYALHYTSVANENPFPNIPPTACAEALDTPPYFIHTYYNFSAGCSTDTDGEIVLYEWDVDYDGVTFNPTLEGQDISTFWNNEGDYQIMLRVTDDLDASDMLDTPLQVTVEYTENAPPVFEKITTNRVTTLKTSEAEAVQLTCYASDFDLGDVLTYEWSCDDGYFLNEDGEHASWVSPDAVGHYWITCRVYDIAGEWDEGQSEMIRVTKYPSPDAVPDIAPPAFMFSLDDIWEGSTAKVKLEDYSPGNVVLTDYWQIG